MIFYSKFKDFDTSLASNNLGLFLRDAWTKHPNARFIDAESGLCYFGADMAKQSKILANSLYELGLRSGDIMTVCCSNSIRTPLLLSALWSLNAVGTALDFGFQAEEYEELASAYKPKGFICVRENLPIALKVRDALPSLKWIIVLDCDSISEESIKCCIFSFGYLASLKSAQVPDMKVDPDLLAYMPRTSGTSGRSKAVMQSHRTIISAILMQSPPEVMPFDSNTVVLSASAIHHVYCLVDVFGCCSYRGFDFVHAQSVDAQNIMQTIERYKISVFFATPYIVLTILNMFKTKHISTLTVSLKSLKTLVTASNIFPESSLPYLRQCLPHLETFGNCYGQTEAMAICCNSLHGFYKSCALGQILAGGKFRIVDPDTLQDKALGERGELLVDVPSRLIGYYNDSKAFKEATIGPWLRTGDICIADEEGFIFLVDRLKEFIKTKYTTISPGEVEAKIVTHPLVKEVAVIGLPHPLLQSALHAVIVPNSPELDEKTIHKYLAENAPDIYKLEGGVTICNSIPRSQMGKLKRQNIVAWVMEKRNENTCK